MARAIGICLVNAIKFRIETRSTSLIGGHIKYLFLSFLLLSVNANAEIISCKEERSTSISWEEKGLIKSASMNAKAENKISNPISVVIVNEKDKATLKGNHGESPLKKLNDFTFLEQNQMGDYFLWTLLKGKDGRPTFLFHQKTYDFMGPVNYVVAYKCD